MANSFANSYLPLYRIAGDDDYVKKDDEESAEEPEDEEAEVNESRGRPKRENVKAKRTYAEPSESDELSDEFEERPAKKSKKADSGSEFDEEEEDLDQLKREAKKFVKSKA